RAAHAEPALERGRGAGLERVQAVERPHADGGLQKHVSQVEEFVGGAERQAVLAEREGEVVLELVDVLIEQVALREALAAGREPRIGGAELAHLDEDEWNPRRRVARVVDERSAGEKLVRKSAAAPARGQLAADRVI